MSEVIGAPRRLDHELKHGSQRQLERNGEASAQIALAVATRDAVHGEHHDLDSGVLSSLQHDPVEAAVPVEIELIDLGRVMRPAQFLKAYCAERGHTEH